MSGMAVLLGDTMIRHSSDAVEKEFLSSVSDATRSRESRLPLVLMDTRLLKLGHIEHRRFLPPAYYARVVAVSILQNVLT